MDVSLSWKGCLTYYHPGGHVGDDDDDDDDDDDGDDDANEDRMVTCSMGWGFIS